MNLTNKNVFNQNTVTVDGDIMVTRLFKALYPDKEFIEDSRPDYFIKKSQFENILEEVYGTTGKSLYKSYLSGRCLDVRLIDEFSTMFVVDFIYGEDFLDRKFKLSSKDLQFANEIGILGDIQDELSKLTPEKYNKRKLGPIIDEGDLTTCLLSSFYYHPENSDKALEFCKKYDILKFDIDSKKPTQPAKTIGFNTKKNE